MILKAFDGRLLFKGGTLLSKIFHAINRFSEDIDLAVDYAALGFTGDKDPRKQNISKSKRNAILAEMMGTCRGCIAGTFTGMRPEAVQNLVQYLGTKRAFLCIVRDRVAAVCR
jgi:hypothetical protein